MYTLTHINQAIYQRMQGPNEMRITGIHKDYDITDRLGQLSVPTLFVCGRHGSSRPQDSAWYHSLVPGAELVVFEHSSHLPHLEEPSPTSRHCATSCAGPSERAVVVAGAASRLRESVGGGITVEAGRWETEHPRDAARRLLTDSEIDRAWAQGRTMGLEDAVAYVRTT